MLTRRHALAAALALLASISTAAAQAQDKSPDKIKVIASFSILADLVRNVGGDRVEVGALVGPNGNAHVYSPSPADARKLADAKAVFVNAMGFEGWLDRLVKASGTKARIIVTTKGIAPRERSDGHSHGHGHDHGRADPHAWQSVANARIYVDNIRDGLTSIDPAGKSTYEANAAAYRAKLDALEREVKETIAKIPPDRRALITSHDSFGYFGGAYGIAFTAPQGVSTESEASAKDVANIIRQIKRRKITAIFLENVTDPRLLKQIASETGAKIGGTLYSDALTDENGDAPTYIDLIRHNLKQLAGALSS
jgi:zinc/manganese transport system substrate-binding protein